MTMTKGVTLAKQSFPRENEAHNTWITISNSFTSNVHLESNKGIMNEAISLYNSA